MTFDEWLDEKQNFFEEIRIFDHNPDPDFVPLREQVIGLLKLVRAQRQHNDHLRHVAKRGDCFSCDTWSAEIDALEAALMGQQ